MLNIVLVEPEIPQNTGNIVRTCAVIGAKLHLIEPLGFSLDEKSVKRAGLDYWEFSDISVYKNLEEFFDKNKGEYFFASTKSKKIYTEVNFPKDSYIFFGKETKGLSEDLLMKNLNRSIRIPMLEGFRSLNLSNSVCIVAYEYLRQHNFLNLEHHNNHFS